jgi:plastocyanin
MKKLAALIVVAILASFGLVACGGGSGSTSSESSSPAGGSAETTEKSEESEAEGGGSGATVDIEANPEGNLEFTSSEASAKAGKATIAFTNSSPVPHDVTIEAEGGETVAQTEIFAEGEESVSANLKPGTYTFYCSVPGHREAGMEGTLTVK